MRCPIPETIHQITNAICSTEIAMKEKAIINLFQILSEAFSGTCLQKTFVLLHDHEENELTFLMLRNLRVI